MRSLWTGAIGFGLVNIPVKLFSATEASSLDLDMLDKKDHSNIRFMRVNEKTGKVVPFMLWGPYLWTDGDQPRTYDSLFWDCEDDFRVDGGGFHLNGEGKDKLALIIDNFFKTDTLAEIWYNDGPKWASCGDGRLADGSIISPTIIDNDEYQLYPTINNGIFTLELPSSNSLIQITITDNLGRIIYTQNVMETEIQNMQLTNIPSGLYFCNIYYDNMHLVKEFIVNK